MNKLILITVVLLILVGCASSPQLYPNKKYQEVGKDGAQKDVSDCQSKADDFVSSSKGKNVAEGAGVGGLIGGAAGAVAGIFGGGVARGALVGGAVGGTAGGVHGALKPDEIKRSFVNQCLH